MIAVGIDVSKGKSTVAILCEQDFHVIDWENDFVCRYETRGREVRQII